MRVGPEWRASPAAQPSGDVASAAAILAARCGHRLQRSFPLAPLTSFRIGGPAALYLEAESESDLAAAAEAVRSSGIAWTVIGKGSNVLVSDHGFAGLVIRLGRGYRWTARDGTRLRAGGAMPLPAFAGVALSHRLAGLEFGVAIPASLGGAVRMNAGAHGHSMSEVVESIDLYSMVEVERSSLSAGEAGFRYRTSRFPRGTLVVGAAVALRPGDQVAIRAAMEQARAWRKATQPLAEPNCGSVFKNPEGDYAARLVEEAGAKGLSVGGASVSTKHSNFIVAGPGSTAGDVLALIAEVRRRVHDRFGLTLETEVELVGDFNDAAH